LVGNYFEEQLKKLQHQYPNVISDVRGKGLLRGIQIKGDSVQFLDQLFKNKMLGVKASENVIRLLPPLIVTKKEIDEGINILEKTAKEFI
jgi:acetylornithine/N-succinyldiaminopimelate aminotransferase